MARIAIIAPHPDDAELGMGGTIALLAAQGHDVLICDMTDGCPTPVGDRATRLAEAAAALKELSPPAGSGSVAGGRVARVMLDLKNREVQHTIEARHKVAGVYRAHQASIVFVPHFLDAHPDHLAVTRIAEDARFDAKLTGLRLPGDEGRPPVYPKWLFHYYCTHLRRVPDPTFIVDTTAFAPAKRRAVEAYRSQFALNEKNRHVPDMIGAADAYFGSRIGAASGEPFYSREPLGLSGLAGLA